MSTISSLLNYTDGIFGAMMDIRIIATTNADTINFDTALTRPGRLCSHVYIDLLKPERASAVYKRLTKGKEKVYTDPVSLAQIYMDSYEGKDKYAKTKKQVVGFGY
jgi:ATP-dependent 26S proteasome regulatory subunit